MPNKSSNDIIMNALQMQYNDPGNSVYLLYQKEVYNCDHSFLQSLMDWLYSSNESPFKFIVRNKAIIKINRFGIIIQKENNAFNMNDESNWTYIHFNLKHLKEIYVDKRHKDTCVLVSKVSSNSCSNYVWKKTNPSNYQSFRSPYGLNNAFKKSYLLTIIKFKDGPSKLLQTIQLLDSILADYNKKEDPKINTKGGSNNELFDATNSSRLGEDLASYYNSMNIKNVKNFRVRPNVQQYFNDAFIKNQQQKFLNAICNNYNSDNNSMNNGHANSSQQIQQSTNNQLTAAIQACNLAQMNPQIVNMNRINTNSPQTTMNFGELAGHTSLRNRILASRNNKRTLSIDNRHNSPLYANYNNNSNKSLQNYQLSGNNTTNNYFPMNSVGQRSGPLYGSSNSVNFSNLSRQGSINEIRPPNNQVLIVNRNVIPGTGYLANTGNYHQPASSPNHFGSSFNSFLDLNTASNTPNGTNNSCNSPQLQTPLIEQCYQGPLSPFGFNPMSLNTNNNTSNENLSEIGYQQYRKKYLNNLSVSSTSSLRNTIDIFSMKPSMISHAKLNHMNHNQNQNNNIQLQKINNANAMVGICRQKELSGSITSMNSGFSAKMSVPHASNAIATTTNGIATKIGGISKKQSTNKNEKIENFSGNDETKNLGEKQIIQTNSKKTEMIHHSNETSSIQRNPKIEKGEEENSKNKFSSKKAILLDLDDNEESTVTIVEEINYKEATKKQHESAKKVEKKRETSVDNTTSRKIPAKVLFDLLKTEADVTNGNQCALKTNFGNCNEMELVTIPSSLGKKLALDIDFLSKTNETCALKDELTSLNRLKESNKVREIINSFNNFEKNNTNSSKDMSSKKKFFSKFNTINISNLGKPPPPVKKFNNPNNKLSTNPATASSTVSSTSTTTTATVIDIQEKKNIEQQHNTASLSFQLNTSESKAEKRLMKLAAANAPLSLSETKQKGGENVSPVSKTLLIPKSANHQQNGNLVFLNNVTAKNLINTENLISKLTDSIIKSDSQSINNDINIINNKLAKIVNMLNNEANNNSGSTVVQGGGVQTENVSGQQQQIKLKKPDNLKALELGQQKASNDSNESSASNNDSLQLPSVNPSRKRTFANMVWPMDPEEEKILRSCSPYEVPEVIVQRNDSVKSILKKNNLLQTITSAPTFVSSISEASNKKRVDFHENCCFINFFEIQDDELITTSS